MMTKPFKQTQRLANKRTSVAWATLLNINFINLNGFISQDYFENVLINKHDFLLMAANCEIEKPQVKSRQEIEDLKKKLVNTN